MQEMQDLSSTPESERSLEENVTVLQYACLGNPMDREAWYPTVPGVAKSLSCLSTHTNKIYSLFYFFFLIIFMWMFQSILISFFLNMLWISTINLIIFQNHQLLDGSNFYSNTHMPENYELFNLFLTQFMGHSIKTLLSLFL